MAPLQTKLKFRVRKKPYKVNKTLKEQGKDQKIGRESECYYETERVNSSVREEHLINARKAFHTSLTSNLPGREEKLEELEKYLMHHLDEEKPGSLYISGPPGTGKTATLAKITEIPAIRNGYKTIFINCTSVLTSISVYRLIAEGMSIKVHGKTSKHFIDVIKNCIVKSQKMILLVLDEIDHLECKNQQVLYSIFEWPTLPFSRLVLIGIANALDMTDRLLPRLRLQNKPLLMHFAPYSKEQIMNILISRLGEWNACEIFAVNSLQLLAAKVAAVSGDVRRALDIARRVVETTFYTRSVKCSTEQSSECLNVVDVLSVLQTAYRPISSHVLDNEKDDSSFPMQQKLVLCSLLLLIKEGQCKTITIGKLHEVYRQNCLKRNILSVDQAEFVGLCNLIETRGIIRIQNNKSSRLSKISLQWDEEEVTSALQDQQLVADILNKISRRT